MSDPPPNPKVTITNSTSLDLEIVDVYNKSGDRTQPFEFTSLGRIAPGKSAEIQTKRLACQLQAMCTGTIPGLGNPQQNFPIAVMAVSILEDQPQSFKVQPSDVDAMVQTFNFIRYVSANPSSKLAQDFVAALKATDQTAAVNTFFAKSASFKSCTIVTWSAITSWQTQFLSPWQGSFYLYDASDNVQQIRLVAGVTISVSGGKTTAELALADAKGQVSSSSQRTQLAMNGGLVTETVPGMGDISVSLTPFWMNVTQQKDGQSRTLIGPALSGTVNNTKVLGNIQPLSASGAGGDGGSGGQSATQLGLTIWHEIQGIAGTLISAGMLLIMFKEWNAKKKDAKNDLVNDSPDPVKDKAKIQKEQAAAEESVDQEMKADMGPRVDSVQQEVQELPKMQDALVQQQKAQKVQDALDVQKEKVHEILEEGAGSEEITDVVRKIQTAQESLSSGDADAALDQLSQANEQLQDVASDRESGFSQEQIDASEKVQEATEEAAKRTEEIDKAAEEQKEADERGATDEFEPDEFAEPKGEPIEIGGR